MELLNVHDRGGAENRINHVCCSEGRCQLFLGKDRSEIMRICTGIVAIPLFRVDVPASSQRVGFGSEFSGTEPEDEVERRKVLGPSGLSTSQEFGCRKIFQIFVIRDHINGNTRSFEVVSPSPEGFENSQEFLIVSVVVQFGGRESTGVESDGMDFSIRSSDREDGGDCIIGGIRFQSHLGVWEPVGKDWSRGESFLEVLERFSAIVGKVPLDVLLGETSERNDDVGVVVNETTVEVGKSEEGLNIPDFPWRRPFGNGLDFNGIHGETFGREDVTEIFDSVRGEGALVGAGI